MENEPELQEASVRSPKAIMAIIGLIMLVVVGVALFGRAPETSDERDVAPIVTDPVAEDIVTEPVEEPGTEEEVDDGNIAELVDEEESPSDAPVVVSKKSFTVEGGNFAFTPSTMRVKKGDVVTVTFNNVEGFHDFVLDEFSVNSGQIESGESKTVTFTADQAGTFEYYCSVGKHREMGMKGTLIVTE